MTKPVAPSATKISPDGKVVAVDENDVALTFEDRLRIFWQKNRKGIVILVIVLIAAILGKGAWDYSQEQKEREIGREFGAITTPDKYAAFASAHSGHTLGAIARLRAADAAYAAGKGSEAITGYEQAITELKAGPLAGRAKLGLAMAKIQAGRTADGEAGLKQIAGDANEPKGIRVEAAYHLASLASVNGKYDEVRKYSEQIMQIDPMSPWTQRVFLLTASLPPAPAPAEAAPGIKLPGK
jgi:predicted negative regulator of RcsB-dependent stress response